MWLARIFVCPLFTGGGTRLKILDAPAQGIPVASTSIGCEGLGLKDGDNILIADCPADFKRQVARLTKDIDCCNRLSVNGRKFVEENFSYGALGAKLERVYEELARDIKGTPS